MHDVGNSNVVKGDAECHVSYRELHSDEEWSPRYLTVLHRCVEILLVVIV